MTEDVSEDYFLKYFPETQYKQRCQDYLDNPKGYEIYRLWYEYLKENEAYKEFCSQTDKDLDSPLYKVYESWGDIHTTPWEDTIERICQRIKSYMQSSDDNPKVWEYSPLWAFDICVQSYKENFKRNPRLKEIRKFFAMEENPKWCEDNILLKVDINTPIEDLTRQFRKIVSEKRKSRELSDKDTEQYAPFPKPSKALNGKDVECLERYLEVYRLRENQGLSWKEVADRIDIDGEIHGKGCFTLDVWRKERNKAKLIIKNAGRNIFPGQYQKSDQ